MTTPISGNSGNINNINQIQPNIDETIVKKQGHSKASIHETAEKVTPVQQYDKSWRSHFSHLKNTNAAMMRHDLLRQLDLAEQDKIERKRAKARAKALDKAQNKLKRDEKNPHKEKNQDTESDEEDVDKKWDVAA